MDDNFIGNKRNAKLLLPQIRTWQEERGYPFSFSTEASVDLADDEEMMRMMHDARFESVFLGIETPDEASLETARKVQNTRNPLDAAVDLKALSIVVWRQGIKRNTRTRFWRYLLGMARNNPDLLAQFLSVLAHNEHFLEYRSIVQQEIREQLESLPPEEPTAAKELQPA